MNNNSLNTSAVQAQIQQLAPITLPKFDGNIQVWESFDLFKAMVRNDDSYSLAQFSYSDLR